MTAMSSRRRSGQLRTTESECVLGCWYDLPMLLTSSWTFRVDDKNLIASDGGVWYFPDPEVFVAGSAKTKKQVEDDIAWTISTRV